MAALLDTVGGLLARYLNRPNPRYAPLATSPPERLTAVLQPCDVLLVEGNTRFSTAIKYLTGRSAPADCQRRGNTVLPHSAQPVDPGFAY